MANAGEADHAYYLSQHLAKKGIEVHVLTTRGSTTQGLGNVRVYPMMKRWSWLEMPLVLKIIKQVKPHTVLLFYSGGPLYQNHPMITFCPTFLKSAFPQTRFVTQFENPFPPTSRSFCTRLVRKIGKPWFDAFGTLLRRSDYLIFLSERQGDVLMKHFPAIQEKSLVLPPPPLIEVVPDGTGMVRELSREDLDINDDEFLLAYFGLIYPSKGIETLLQALKIVKAQKPNVRLVLIGGVGGSTGEKYQEEMKHLSKQLGLDPHVIWVGGYERGSHQASTFLRAADLGVLPMDRGIALNNSSLAAMVAHGLPVVTTKGESLEQPFQNGKNLLLCESQDPNGLARAIIATIDDSGLRNRLQKGSVDLAHECFSWEGTVRKTLSICSADPTANYG